MRNRPPRTFRLDASALAQARVPLDVPLCLPRAAWQAVHTLQAGPPMALEKYGAGTRAASRTEVAIITIEGLLAQEADSACGWWDGYGGETGIVARFTEAACDESIGTIVLRMRSPGGTSAGCEEGIRRMCEVRDATGVKVLAFVDERCGSAAYWIAAVVAREGIYGPTAAYCGSVGSYIPHEDISGALAQAGIVETLIADPPGKVAGASSKPLDDVGRARLERDVFACTARFVAAVASARGISPEQVRAIDADMLPMADAVAAGLADGEDSLEGVLDLAATLAANNTGDPMPFGSAAGARARHLRPSGPRAASGDPMAPEDALDTFKPGDRVRVTAEDVVGEVTPTECYEVQIDGEDSPRLFREDELEPETPAAAPAEGAQQRAMKRVPSATALELVRASGLAPGAGDAVIRARAAELLGGASWMLKATGAKTIAEAQGVVSAWKRAAGELPTIKAKLEARDASDEQARRIQVCEEGVRAGVWTPGKAWKDGEKTKGLSAWASAPHKGPNGEDLGQSLAQLEADLRASAPLAFTAPAVKPAVTATNALTDDEQTAAKRAGATNEEWESARASVLAGELPKGKRVTR